MPRQGLTADKGGTQVSEVTFLLLGEKVVEAFADKVSQHCVAQKLQALVVDQFGVVVEKLVEKTAVNKGAVQQG